MSAIGPGDWVERTDDKPDGTVRRGAVARLVGFGVEGRCRCGHQGPSLLLDLAHTPGTIGWCPSHWAPIYRPKASFLEGLLTPADAPADLQGVDA